MSAAEYRACNDAFVAVQNEHGSNMNILTIQEYHANPPFQNTEGQVFDKPVPGSRTKFLVVKNTFYRPDEIILLESPIDLNNRSDLGSENGCDFEKKSGLSHC